MRGAVALWPVGRRPTASRPSSVGRVLRPVPVGNGEWYQHGPACRAGHVCFDSCGRHPSPPACCGQSGGTVIHMTPFVGNGALSYPQSAIRNPQRHPQSDRIIRRIRRHGRHPTWPTQPAAGPPNTPPRAPPRQSPPHAPQGPYMNPAPASPSTIPPKTHRAPHGTPHCISSGIHGKDTRFARGLPTIGNDGNIIQAVRRRPPCRRRRPRTK